MQIYTYNPDGTVDIKGEPEPTVPRDLTKLEFVEHLQDTGGMTDTMLDDSMDAPQLRVFWKKFELANNSIKKEHPITRRGLDALVQLGYLPNGKQAVLDAWPVE